MVSAICIPVLLTLLAQAPGDNPPKEDPLPPPRVIAPPIEVVPPSFVRPNRLEVWQNYGVTRQGRFRPLVIASPHGPYYYVDGKPYPWALMHSLDWWPYITH